MPATIIPDIITGRYPLPTVTVFYEDSHIWKEAQSPTLYITRQSTSQTRKHEGHQASRRLRQAEGDGVGGVGCHAPPVIAAGAGIHSAGNQWTLSTEQYSAP